MGVGRRPSSSDARARGLKKRLTLREVGGGEIGRERKGVGREARGAEEREGRGMVRSARSAGCQGREGREEREGRGGKRRTGGAGDAGGAERGGRSVRFSMPLEILVPHAAAGLGMSRSDGPPREKGSRGGREAGTRATGGELAASAPDDSSGSSRRSVQDSDDPSDSSRHSVPEGFRVPRAAYVARRMYHCYLNSHRLESSPRR